MGLKKWVLGGLIGLIFILPSTHAQTDRQVWAFYMGFWTLDGWEQSASVLTDEPLARYDSREPSIARQQIQQAKNAGIDAFIVSWFNDEATTATLNNLLDQASGFKIGAAVDSFQNGTLRNQAAMVEALTYLISDRVNHPAYLRFGGKPVIYFAFQEKTGFGNATWQSIRDTVDPNRQTIWVAEGVNGCCLHGGVFDGMYAFNVAWGDPATTTTTQFERLRNAGGYFYTPTVHPGWDERLVAARDGRPNPTAPRERGTGDFLRASWNGAVASGGGIILMVSWNEFMEGSHIEPSVKYGSQALDILRPLIADWKAGRIPTQVTEAVNPPTQGTNLTIQVESLNVRAEPNTGAGIVASVFQGQNYAILGESGGWYLIQVNGVQGYVLGDYVRIAP